MRDGSALTTCLLLATALALSSCGADDAARPLSPANEGGEAGAESSPATGGDASSGAPQESVTPLAGQLDYAPNIVLVTVDTLRADHLSCYGYPRPTSPRLDAFAEEGVLFERAMATMASTLPSHLSMLTGLYPHQHGMLSNLESVTHNFTSAPGRRSVAEILGEAGYTTAAFISALPLGTQTGIQVGFQTFDAAERQLSRLSGKRRQRIRPAERTNLRVVEWLDTKPKEPFFLWVHYWDPHEPNRPPEDALRSMQEAGHLDEVMAHKHLESEEFSDVHGKGKNQRMFFPDDVEVKRSGEIGMSALRGLHDRYDADVLNTDVEFGYLLDVLQRGGYRDRTMVAFTADHGQALGERGWLGHGRLDGVNIHVPLVIRFPKGVIEAPLRIEGVVSLVDLMPTLLGRFELEGLEEFRVQATGLDLLSGTFERPLALSQRTSRALGGEPAGDNHTVVGSRFKFVRFSEAPDELYDVKADPFESENLLKRYPRIADRMAQHLEEILSKGIASESDDAPVEIDPQLLKEFGELGYTGDD